MDSVKSFFKKVRVDAIVRAILYIVMAVLFFIDPIAGMTSASIAFAILMLIDGVTSLVIYFCSYGISGFFGTTLLGSIFKIICGILFLVYPGFSTVTISLMMAIYIIVTSCNGIENAFRLKKISGKWVVPFILSLASLVAGVVMLFLSFLSPANLVSVCGYIAGAVFAVDAIVEIVVIIDMYRAKKAVKDVKKEVEETITPNDDDIIDA